LRAGTRRSKPISPSAESSIFGSPMAS
jgi:hypothetical protein